MNETNLMNLEKEIQLAKAPYNWLKASPLLTIPTLFFITSIVAASDIFYYFCLGDFDCGSGGKQAMEFGVGVLGSALWHLLLLQYVNNRESELIREHGRKALAQAGIRTGVAFFGVMLDWLANADGGFACIVIGILTLIWVINATQSKGWVEGNKPPVPTAPESVAGPVLTPPIVPTQEILDQIFADLDSEDDVAVITAIDKLGRFSEVNEAILNRLEELADEDENEDIRMDARVVSNRLKGGGQSGRVIAIGENADPIDPRKPDVVLDKIYKRLQGEDDIVILQAIAELANLNYSSVAIRRRLEKLAVKSESPTVRMDALNALNLPANRAVQGQTTSRKLERNVRFALLHEVDDWESSELLNKQTADVLRRRYDFDIAPRPAPQVVSTQAAVPTPQADPSKPAPAETPTQVAAPKPQVPPEPRLSLLQTLTSESAIRIYLYLGAFFVIAAAAILGAVVPELRLPILIIGTLIFGGLAIVIKKRLPQPSFALFIVFSLLLPITANSLHESLKEGLNFTAQFTGGYWGLVYLVMAAIWAGSTRLYDSRFFSVASFVALILSFFNAGTALDAKVPVYTFMMGFAAIIGLAWAWLLKRWKDTRFALPTFIAAQILQAVILIISLSFFVTELIDPSFKNLLHLFTFGTWLLGTVFYLLSDRIQPFFAFPWVAGAALVPLPLFLAAAFDLESFGSAVLLAAWGLIVAIAGEMLSRFERAKRYSLPFLLASLPSLALGTFVGFFHEIWLGFALCLVDALLLTALHAIRTRWWIWTIALLDLAIAYFAFFQLGFINGQVFFGFQLVGVVILLLLPDLLLKKHWTDNLPWRLPPRIYGALFLLVASISLLSDYESGRVAMGYAGLALFCAVYALAYRKPFLGYIPAAHLPLALVYALDAFRFDAWIPALSVLTIVYFIAGFVVRKNEKWSVMLRYSSLVLAMALTAAALILTKETSGWFIAPLGFLFIAEMHLRKNGWFEIGASTLITAGVYLILRDLNVTDLHYYLFAISLVWIFTDLVNHLTFRHPRPLTIPIRGIGALLASIVSLLVLTANPADAAICYGVYTLVFTVVAFVHRRTWLGYIPAAALSLTILFALDHFNSGAWLPVLTGLAVLYFVAGYAIRAKEGWSIMLRNSALILGSILSLSALIVTKDGGGWYAFVIGLFYIAEMSLRKNGWFEPGAPLQFTLGVYLILYDFKVEQAAYHLLAYSLIWLLADLLAHLAFPNPRPLKWLVRALGGIFAIVNYGFLFLQVDAAVSAVGFAVYSLLFLTLSLLYRQPKLLYAFTLTLPLFAAFLFRTFSVTQWIHPVIVVAAFYYGMGFFLRRSQKAKGWETPLLNSGLGLGVIVSVGAVILGGLDASIPVAIAATLWAVEAYARKNAWLAFPANALYLTAYLIILFDLNVDEPQFFSIGVALFGLIQHYLLTRAENKTGTFIMGMVSQLVLLGTTYIEMINRNDLTYFFLLFIQSLVILVYGIVIRSRSLTFFPIGFVALGVVTVVYSALKDRAAIFVIGCTGILLLMLGVGAVLLRERIAKLGEKLSDWKA